MARKDVVLNLITKGKDQTKGALASLKAGITGIKDGFLKLGGLARSAGRIVASALKTIAIAAAAAAAAIALIGWKLIKAASDAEEISSKFDAVFKGLKDGTREWVNVTATALNRSRFDLEKYASSLQDTFVPIGFARDKAAELSKQLVVLGIDLASFNNVAEPETIELLTSALVGNHEAVRRFGIQITEGTLKQELLRMGVKKSVQQVDIQTKVMARLNIIMRSTKDAQGDAARTANEFANRMRGLGAAVREAAVDFGNQLLPAASEAIGTMTEAVKESATAFSTVLGPVVRDISMQFATMFKGLVEALGEREAMQKFSVALRNAIIGVFNWFVALSNFAKGPGLRSMVDFGIGTITSLQAVSEHFRVLNDDVTRITIAFQKMALAVFEGLVALQLLNLAALSGGIALLPSAYKKLKKEFIEPGRQRLTELEAEDDASFEKLRRGLERDRLFADAARKLGEITGTSLMAFAEAIPDFESIAPVGSLQVQAGDGGKPKLSVMDALQQALAQTPASSFKKPGAQQVSQRPAFSTVPIAAEGVDQRAIYEAGARNFARQTVNAFIVNPNAVAAAGMGQGRLADSKSAF